MAYRILTDHLGSVRLVVDSATGSLVQRIDYDEWGNVLSDTSPGFQPFGFAGGLCDRDTKLTRFGARDYDPEIGRWTVKDPILFSGGQQNFFAYASLNPIGFSDPRGLDENNGPPITLTIIGEDGLPVGIGTLGGKGEEMFHTEEKEQMEFYSSKEIMEMPEEEPLNPLKFLGSWPAISLQDRQRQSRSARYLCKTSLVPVKLDEIWLPTGWNRYNEIKLGGPITETQSTDTPYEFRPTGLDPEPKEEGDTDRVM